MEQKTFGVVRFFANTPPVPSKQVRWISLGEFKGVALARMSIRR
jgi:hypothetical protein